MLRKVLSKHYGWLFGTTLLFVIYLSVYLFAFDKMDITVFFPNEISYWANAAAMLGYDWSGIAARYSYFSFGYSFLLVVPLKWLENPALLYKTAVFFNVLMAGAHGAMLLWILKKQFSKVSEKYILTAGIIGAVYPALIFYLHVTLPEVLLNLLFVSSVCLLVRWLENRKWYNLLFLFLLWTYQYFVHMRSLGVVLAGLIVVAMNLDWKKPETRKKAAGLFLLMILAVVCGYLIKGFLEGNVYRFVEAAGLSVNDFAGQIGKIQSLFSVQGIINMLMSMAGKLYYLGTATFGTFYWGMYYLGKKGFGSEKNALCLYLFLAVLFSFLIHALFMSGSGRIDTLLYGRYNEMLIPLIMGIGILAMLQSNHAVKGVLAGIVLNSMLATCVFSYIIYYQLDIFYGHYVTGLLYFVSGNAPTVSQLIKGSYLAGSLLSLLLLCAILFCKKLDQNGLKRGGCAILALFAAVNLLVGIIACYRYQTYADQDAAYEDIALAEKISQLCGKEKNEKDSNILFLNRDEGREIDYMQFCMRDQTIQVQKESETELTDLLEDTILLTYWNSPLTEELKKIYEEFIQQGHYNCYYNKREEKQ